MGDVNKDFDLDGAMEELRRAALRVEKVVENLRGLDGISAGIVLHSNLQCLKQLKNASGITPHWRGKIGASLELTQAELRIDA